MAEVASESWWIKLGVMYDKSGFKAAIGGMLDLRRVASNLADTFKKVVDANSDLYNTARYLNVSTGQLQVWERAFRLIGGSADEARGAISNLNFVYDQLRLGMGGEKAEIGARLHLNPEDFLTFETMMEALNRSFNTYFNGDYGAFKVLAEQLGLSEHAMLLVTQSTEEFHKTIKRANSIPLIPEHQLEAARKLQEQFTRLSISWDNFKTRIVSASFPALNKLFQDIERTMANPEVEKGLVRFFDTLEKGFNDLSKDQNLVKLVENLSILSTAAVKVLDWGSRGVTGTIKGAQSAGTALGNVSGALQTGQWRSLSGMFGIDRLFDKPVEWVPTNNASGNSVTQYITINGAQSPKATGEAVAEMTLDVNGVAAQRAVETREANSIL